jgi:hypothetical protein
VEHRAGTIIIVLSALVFILSISSNYDLIPRALGVLAGTVLSGILIAYVIKTMGL